MYGLPTDRELTRIGSLRLESGKDPNCLNVVRSEPNELARDAYSFTPVGIVATTLFDDGSILR